MMRSQRVLARLAYGLLGLVLAATPLVARAEPDLPRVIDLYAAGPKPQRLEIRAGDAVLWVSHLAHTKLVVVTVAFFDGARIAQAIDPVAG